MASDDVPNQVRVRTDGENSYRYHTIMSASERFSCNKTRAIVLACDVAGTLVNNVEDALQHPDLPPAVAADIADTLSTRHIDVTYEPPRIDVQEKV